MKMTKEELSRAYTHKKVEEKIVSHQTLYKPTKMAMTRLWGWLVSF